VKATLRNSMFLKVAFTNLSDETTLDRSWT